jgi:hypothetical protein
LALKLNGMVGGVSHQPLEPLPVVAVELLANAPAAHMITTLGVARTTFIVFTDVKERA